MIEQQTINGRKATIAYINADFSPADKDAFKFAKILFDDGEMIFLAAPPPDPHADAYAPWISDPDDPDESMISSGAAQAAARNVAASNPDLVDRSMDGPILKFLQELHIDILQYELDGKLPHWLTVEAKMAGRRVEIRAKHLAKHLAERAARPKSTKPPSSEAMARLTAAYAIAKAKDPAFAAFAEPEEMPEKLQLVTWAKAIMVLDGSEIIIRDLIERDLAGSQVMPIARILVVTAHLVRKVVQIREHAIKTAFRLLRDRLGDKPILDASFAAWAQALARDDAASITAAIQQGLGDGLDSTEIARKVVGTRGLNGVDGCTEFPRHKLAHIGRAAIKESRARAANSGV